MSTTSVPSLWRNFSFMLMWTSVAASGFGDRMIQLAAEPLLGVKEAGASGANVQSGVMFFFLAPYMGLTLVGGWLADRLPRKWIMLFCDEGRAVALGIGFYFAGRLAVGESVPLEHRWKVFVVIALTGAFAAIFNPAKQSTMPQLVRSEDLQQANAVIAGIAIIASLLGVVVGAPIIEKVSVRLGIGIGIVSFAVSGCFFAFLKIRRTRHGPDLAGKKAGPLVECIDTGRFIVSHRAVRTLVLLNVLFWSAVWVVNAAIAALSRSMYGINPDVYLTAKAAMLGALAIGLFGGSVAVMLIRTRRESGLLTMTSLFVAAITMVFLAFVHVFWVGVGLTFVIGIFGGVFLIAVDTLTQTVTPNYIRGRVFGLRAFLNTISGVLINLVIWRLPVGQTDRLMIPTLAACAVALLIVSVVGLWRVVHTGPHGWWLANAVWRLARLYALSWHRLRWSGRHHIPREGPLIVASNHTTGLDPTVLQSAAPRIIRWLMLTSYRFRLAEPLWRVIDPITLDRDGSDLPKIRAIVDALRDGDAVGLFPEGGLQRDKREMGPFQPGLAMIAKRSRATIVPAWISGTPRRRKIIWHFLQPSRSRVTFGPPYVVDEKMSNEQIMEDLRRRILELKKLDAGEDAVKRQT